MADKALVYEVNQIRTEATPGTDPGTGTKLLQALAIDLGVEAEVDVFGPAGQKYDTLSILNREWASGAVSGKPTYTELVYPLSSVLTTPVITTPATGVLARQWDWTPLVASADSQKTFTVERGQQGAALGEKSTNLLITELGLVFSRLSGVEMSGTAIARALVGGITLDPAPVAVELIPIMPGQVSVYVDSTAGSIGTTKLLRDFEVEWRIGDRNSPIWPLNAAMASFDGTIEKKPTTLFRLSVGNDTFGQSLLTTMRTGARKYVRMEAVGDIIELAIPYRFRIDACVIISAGPSRGDIEGLSTLDWSFRMAHDATWGKPFTVQLTNKLTSL